jgi:hypothetical protein
LTAYIFLYFDPKVFRDFFLFPYNNKMETIKNPKNPKKFECTYCNYITSSKKDYEKHLLTRKHMKETGGPILETKKNPPKQSIVCDICGKIYKNRTGLWKHQQKCSPKQEPTEETPIETSEPPPTMNDQSMVIELLKQNQELQKQLIEALKVSGPHIENQTNINNNNNQKFNLNFFLNEQCKDAINMSDFLENMELNMEDLTETGRLGYVGGISRILVNKLQELDVYKRPMHCTDVKRETLYIKDNDEWEKQANSKKKMDTIINKVANMNCKIIPQWQDEHPEYQVFDTLDNLEYMNLCNVALGGLGEEENRQLKDKIVRSVVKEVMVDKM